MQYCWRAGNVVNTTVKRFLSRAKAITKLGAGGRQTKSSAKLAKCPWNVVTARLRHGVALGLVLDGDLAEQEPAGLAARTDEHPEHEHHLLADEREVDGHAAQHRREVPDVTAGQAGELATPAQSQRDPAQHGEELVTAVEWSGEAWVAATPHTVDWSHTFWLGQYLFETHLQHVNNNITITVSIKTRSNSNLQVIATGKLLSKITLA